MAEINIQPVLIGLENLPNITAELNIQLDLIGWFGLKFQAYFPNWTGKYY